MNDLSRRKFFGIGLGAAAVAGVAPLSLTPVAHASPSNPLPKSANAKAILESIGKAVDFLNTMMDAYASGATVRLIESYSDQGGLESTGFTYDNAVAVHAYLLHGTHDSLNRAQIPGDALIEAQQ